MKLEKLQLRDKNRIAFWSTIAILGSVLLLSMAALSDMQNIGMMLRFGYALLAVIVNIVLYRKSASTMIYRHVACISLIIAYALIVFTVHVMYMYAYVFPIAIMVMIYADKRLSAMGAIIAFAGVVIYCVRAGLEGFANDSEIFMAIVLVGMVCVMCMCITTMTLRHNIQTMDEVKKGVDAQSAIASKIIELSDELGKKFVQAKTVSDTLNETMDTNHSAVSEIAESTHLNAEAITEQTSQTADIQESIETVGSEAKQMGEISERTNATVKEGVELIERLKEQATEVAKINLETKTTTEALNESIKAVEAITETILGISSQTNLLALNASIEAARAGEAGKGFAVVADEIRKLSEDTRVATEQISSIINQLTADANSASQSMALSAEYADKQNELIAETGTKLFDIKEDTDALHEGVVQVNGSVENIITANTMIMDSISNLSATGEEVAASTDTALSISESSMDALKNMNEVLAVINDISSEMEKIAKGEDE